MKQPLQIFFLLCLIAPRTCFATIVTRFTDCIDFFVDDTTPDIPGILLDGAIQDQNVYSGLCQMWPRSGPGSKNQFATLYDTSRKIPVFSAYTYTGKHGGQFKRPNWRIDAELKKDEQATRADYEHQSEIGSEHKVNRGHIFPVQHAHDKDSAISTFTLTNAVPQKLTFNGGSWGNMENYVRDLMDKYCKDNNNKPKAYVVTGAVPGGEKMNNRVWIPKLMWTSFCCYNTMLKKWVSKAHWADNVDEEVGNEATTIIRPRSLTDLHEELKNQYPDQKGKTVKVFPDKCLHDLDGIPYPAPTSDTTRSSHDNAVCDSAPDNVTWYTKLYTRVMKTCFIM